MIGYSILLSVNKDRINIISNDEKVIMDAMVGAETLYSCEGITILGKYPKNGEAIEKQIIIIKDSE